MIHLPPGPVWDASMILQPGDIQEIKDRLDILLREHPPIRCLGVALHNTALHAILFTHLLERNTNLFIVPGNSPVAGDLPPFCDATLEDGPAGTPGETEYRQPQPETLVDGVRITDRGSRTEAPRTFEPDSGIVLFASSGTTGAPKYVRYRSSRLLQNARNCADRFGLTTDSRILVTVPSGHMFGMGVGLLPAVLTGADVCLIHRNNVVKFMETSARFGPTLTLVTPAFIKMLLQLNKVTKTNGLFVSAGERLQPEAYGLFEDRWGTLLNLYGCTELGAIAVSPEGDAISPSRRQGLVRALPGVEVVLDEARDGSIQCRHNAGFDGYVSRDGEALAPPIADTGWFRTGDLGTPGEEGCFYVKGRSDNCVNRSGFLISLDDIASRLEALLPGIRQALVLSIDGDDQQRLAAICELSGIDMPDEEVVRRLCREKMNKYLVPDEFHFVADLPRLHNGKPDRASLKKRYDHH